MVILCFSKSLPVKHAKLIINEYPDVLDLTWKLKGKKCVRKDNKTRLAKSGVLFLNFVLLLCMFENVLKLVKPDIGGCQT